MKLTLEAEFIRNQPVPYTLDVMEGDRLIASWTPGRERVWERVVVGTFDWRAGQPLILSAHGPAPPGALNGAILDRVKLEWR